MAESAPLDALEAISEAVESGAGLPEVVRAAARALDCSLALIDRSTSVLAVAAQSSADERALMADGPTVQSSELRVGDEPVGRLRLRPRSETPPPPAVLRLVTTLLASEVQRVRAPAHASAVAQEDFLRAVLERRLVDPAEILARGRELGADLSSGAGVVVIRGRHLTATEDDWRARLLTVALRGARATAPGALAALEPGGQVLVLLPAVEETVIARVAAVVLRELEAAMHGFAFAVGHSRHAADPGDLYRAGNEALLAANVAEAGAQPVLAFEDTGAYRLLLPAMSEDPGELRRFYEDTVAPVVAYDEQYETDLVRTVETFLDADGNVAGTAERLYTHRHTVRYRLERVRELSGLDVGSTDGREKLGLGLKAMRVLGIASPAGPATESGARGGRVTRPDGTR